MNAGRVILVRHGQASFGSKNYDRLSPVGVRQSQLLGQWWARYGQPPGTVVCGTLERHRETARACLEAWGLASLPLQEDAALNEFDHHDVLTRYAPNLADPEELANLLAGRVDAHKVFQRLFADAVTAWINDEQTGLYKESWQAFNARCADVLIRIANRCDADGSVIVFTSGGPIGSALQSALAIPDSKVLDIYWAIRNASVTTLESRRGRLTASAFNVVSHLEAVNDASLITYR